MHLIYYFHSTPHALGEILSYGFALGAAYGAVRLVIDAIQLINWVDRRAEK